VLGIAVLAVVFAGVSIVVRDVRQRSMIPLFATTLALLLVTFTSRMTAGSDINARVLSPVYPLLVVLGLWLFDYVRGAAHSSTVGRIVKVLARFGLAGLVAFGVGAVALAWNHGRAARTFAGSHGPQSQLVAATRAIPSSASVYSDDPLTISYVTERQPVRLLLAPGQPNVIGRTHPSTAELQLAACSKPIWVAWFARRYPLPLALTHVHRYRDGILGRVAAHCT
jgi:hypothetical protein